jgi:hypothetical protein
VCEYSITKCMYPCFREFVMGTDWRNAQLGCLWQGSELLTVNVKGHIIYHSLETPQQPKRIIKVGLYCSTIVLPWQCICMESYKSKVRLCNLQVDCGRQMQEEESCCVYM